MASVFNFLAWGTVSLDVMACGYASAAVVASRQEMRLSRLLAVARRDSRYYREKLPGALPGGTSLQALPMVSKQELMANFDDWVTDPQLKLSEISRFTADPARIAQPYLGKYLLWESSGTSNQPGVFVQDAHALAVYDALEALRPGVASPGGAFLPWQPRQRMAFVGAIGGHFASVVSIQRLRQLNPWMARDLRCFSILQPTRALVEELNAFAPAIIATYPTVATLLAQEASRGALHSSLDAVWTGGETLSLAVRNRVSQALGCAVRNSYGASEFMSIAWECRCGHLHVNADWVILEPVDEKGQPTPPGQPSYSTLLTNLANHVQPLIRYDLGDQIIWHPEPCDCGSPLPVIEVQGRRDDALVMAGPQGQKVTLLPLALTTVLEDEAGMFDFQLRQRNARTLVLRLDLPQAEAAAAAARCRQALSNFALQQGASPIRIITEFGAAIPRGRSGKAQRVVAARGAGDAGADAFVPAPA
jgi:phenylacetate-coenzyme A ligase PaaK-like adenylate-forming protein